MTFVRDTKGDVSTSAVATFLFFSGEWKQTRHLWIFHITGSLYLIHSLWSRRRNTRQLKSQLAVLHSSRSKHTKEAAPSLTHLSTFFVFFFLLFFSPFSFSRTLTCLLSPKLRSRHESANVPQGRRDRGWGDWERHWSACVTRCSLPQVNEIPSAFPPFVSIAASRVSKDTVVSQPLAFGQNSSLCRQQLVGQQYQIVTGVGRNTWRARTVMEEQHTRVCGAWESLAFHCRGRLFTAAFVDSALIDWMIRTG